MKPDPLMPREAVPSLDLPRPGGAIDFAIGKDYPARGEYAGEV